MNAPTWLGIAERQTEAAAQQEPARRNGLAARGDPAHHQRRHFGRRHPS